jgi:hypothetical protein
MTTAPANPKIYHITHIDNLDAILRDKVLWSDAKRLELDLECENIGISEIKRRRLEELQVNCHPNTMVGQYVPFYFCPRSIMLFILHRGNHRDITYRGGQEPIIHLEADLKATVGWAENNNVRWAFSDRNAGGYLAKFYRSTDDLDKINWPAVESTDFRDMLIKEDKQAEFLMYESFPLNLVEKIGVCNSRVRDQVIQKLGNAGILVTVEGTWYY